MAGIRSLFTRSSAKYEPLPRFDHISGRVGSKVVVQGGRTNDFSEKRKQQLSSVVETFDPYSELWEQRQVEGDARLPGTYAAASASLNDDLFLFGGTDGRQRFNTVRRLDSKTWCWSQLSPQNADGAPMPKTGCGMIAFRDSLVMFGGYGVPRGPTEPQSFIKNTRYPDGRGWTNEFHTYNPSEDVWSCPATTGERPPPFAHFTFTAVDDRRAVLFGGFNGGPMNDVFIIDLFTMNWSKLSKSGGGPWPEERSFHAACCLNYGQRFPQLLVTGGLDRRGQPLAGAWILDVERVSWRKVNATLKARSGHSLTAFSLGPGLTEVVVFGGTPEPYTRSNDTQPKMADTTLLQFRLVESSGQSQLELLSVVSNTQRGSQNRIIEKLRHTAEGLQQSIGGREMTRMERQQLERERETVRELEGERERERERVRDVEEERDRFKAEVVLVKGQKRKAEDKAKLLEQEKAKAEQEIIIERQTLEARLREAEINVQFVQMERNKQTEERKRIELERDLMLIEKEGVKERVSSLERERERARNEATQAILDKETFKTRADSQTMKQRNMFQVEKQKIEEKVTVLERERHKATLEKEEQKEKWRQEKKEFEERMKTLEKERDNVKEEKRNVEIERDRARHETRVTLERIKELERERDTIQHSLAERMQHTELETGFEKQEVEPQKTVPDFDEETKMQELRESLKEQPATAMKAEGRARTLEEEIQEMATTLEKEGEKMSEIAREGEERVRELERKMEGEKSEKKAAKVTVRELEGERERERERVRELEGEREREGVRELKGERERERERERVREMEGERKRERVRELEGERERERVRVRELEGERERDRGEPQRAQARADELQRRLDEVERREHEKSVVQEQAIAAEKRGPSWEVKEDEKEVTKIDVIAEKTVQVTNKEQNIDWEGCGLRLHIPDNSLPENCSQFQLKMTVSRPKDYKLPVDEGLLVSAVYSFSHDLGDRKLRQPATLELQHCASSPYTPLYIIQSDEVTPPYQFHILQGGKFDRSDGYGSIKLDHFCCFGVYLRWFVASLIWSLKHCAVLYYTHIKSHSFQFRLYIAPLLNAILKAIHDDVKEKHDPFERGPVSLFEFDEDEPVIRLQLPADCVSGWTMNHLNNAEMNADDIVNMRSDLIPFQVRVKWSEDQGHPLRELEYDTVITGAKRHKLRVVSPDQCTKECETVGTATSLSSSTTTPITPQDFEGLPPPDLKNLMEFVGVDVQADWKAVGLKLGLKSTALNTIKANNNGETKNCMTEVFTQWHDGKTSEYSWKTLAAVLCSKMVNKPGLLPDILHNIKKLSS